MLLGVGVRWMRSGSHPVALVVMLMGCSVWSAAAQTLYVSTNSVLDGPGTAWSNAFHVIQNAVDAASGGYTILVTNGVYDVGGAVAPGQGLSSRVCIATNLSLVSVNGPEVTRIVGHYDDLGDLEGNGPYAVRGLYLVDGASVTGFTIEDGHTFISGGVWLDWAGGGVLFDGGGILRRCIIRDCSARFFGGGVEYDEGGRLESCLVVDNISAQGGGMDFSYGGEILNCTVSANHASQDGGGISCLYGGMVSNTIVWANTSDGANDNIDITGVGHSFDYACTTPDPGGTSNLTANPLFTNTGSENYRLLYSSPCIDRGTNVAALTADLDGTTRVINAVIDLGAYEYDGSWYDPDGDGLVDADELMVYGTSPTNSNTDGDPHNDYEEMIADTDGANSNDYFRITNATFASPVTIHFKSSSNRLYTMASRTNLVDGAWSNVLGDGPRVGIGGPDSMVDTNATPPAFYRLTVELLP